MVVEKSRSKIMGTGHFWSWSWIAHDIILVCRTEKFSQLGNWEIERVLPDPFLFLLTTTNINGRRFWCRFSLFVRQNCEIIRAWSSILRKNNLLWFHQDQNLFWYAHVPQSQWNGKTLRDGFLKSFSCRGAPINTSHGCQRELLHRS